MNFFSITNQIKYFFVYHNQNVKQNRQKKFDSDRVFDTKIITDSFSKMRFQITSKNEFNFKKKKFFKTKNHVYMTNDDEKKIDYYKLNNEKNQFESKINHENQNSFLNQFEKRFFVELTNSIMSSSFKSIQCKKCKTVFFFNNKLHKHIRDKCFDIMLRNINFAIQSNAAIESATKNETQIKTKLFILNFKINFSQKLEIDFEFRNYQYVMTCLNLIKNGSDRSKCLNIETNFIIMNKNFFLNQSKNFIRIMITKIIVREIDSNKHQIKKYVINSIFFQNTNEKDQ